MVIKIFNTMSRKKELLDSKKVKMFVCGPTVYDYSHLGHARTYISYDIMAKYLRYRKIKLFFLMNITDIDDKIINRANETKVNPLELSRKFENSFYEDVKILGIDSVDMFARASEHIHEIIDQVRRLVEKKFAYVTETGVYYDITKFKDYGKLSRQNLEELKKHRIEPDPTKKNPQDFALWKIEKPGEISWDSPWGKGRPGWHIEDTAISEKYLGQQYDIHGGGIDLIFPHHEAEIAQMESVSGKKPMVRIWTHTEFLRINGEKMAKSLGNFITIRDALKENDPETLRLFFAFTHYRRPVDYNKKNLEKARNSLESLYETLKNIEHYKKNVKPASGWENILKEARVEFEKAMDDDFNTPAALSVMFELQKKVNKLIEERGEISQKLAGDLIKIFTEFGNILGILKREMKETEMTKDVERLIGEREVARKGGDWKKADEIRKKISELGFILEDTPKGSRVKKK
jgi:cysteinyl-tRNA synthetase